MDVRLLVCRVGPQGTQKPGVVISVSSDEGKRMCEARQAVPVRKKREKAVPKSEDVETRDG